MREAFVIDPIPTTTPIEQWKPVLGYEQYEASTFGQVRLVDSGLVLTPHRHMSRSEKVYLRVNLKRYGKKKAFVHTLVALAFLGPRPEPHPEEGSYQVCHKNDNGLDNRLDNLKWGTMIENQRAKRCYREAHAVPLLERGDSWEEPT